LRSRCLNDSFGALFFFAIVLSLCNY
jgi:hypothetical protein